MPEAKEPRKKNRTQELQDAKRKAVRRAICETFANSGKGVTIEQIADLVRKYGFGKTTAQKYLNEMIGTKDILENPGKPTIYILSESGHKTCNMILEEK